MQKIITCAVLLLSLWLLSSVVAIGDHKFSVMRPKKNLDKRKRIQDNFEQGLANHDTMAPSHYLEDECSTRSDPVLGLTKGKCLSQDSREKSVIRPKKDFNKRRRFFEDLLNFEQGLGGHETMPMLHQGGNEGSSSSNLADRSIEHDESEEDSSDDEDVCRILSGSEDAIFGQTSYQRSHGGVIVDYDDSGDDVYVCSHCTAFF